MLDSQESSKVLPKIYFDCNATTPVLPGAANAAIETMNALYGNPSSTHTVGLHAKHVLENARQITAEVVGANAEQIIFTSGATEAIQIAIFSVLHACKQRITSSKNKLLYGATEHKVISQTLHHWVKILDLPYEIVELPVDGDGQLDINQLKEILPEAVLLCTMAVNNETGVMHDLAAIEKCLLNSHSDAYWLVDSVQALGKLDLNLNDTRIDYAAFSGHKLYAPKGVGFLYRKQDAPVTPLIVGGGQERTLRSGTENLPGIAALGYVMKQLITPSHETIFRSYEQLMLFRNKLIAALTAIFPNIIFNTPIDHAIPTTLNFSVPGLSSKELLGLFDAGGLYLSGGSACSSGSLKSSHVLDAMGKEKSVSDSAVRLSFGPCTTLDEIEQACNILNLCGEELRKACLLKRHASTEIQDDSTLEGILQLRTDAANTWIVTDKATRHCIIIDPCAEVSSRIEQMVQCQNLKILAILDTHSHADHESIRPQLQQKLASHFYLKENECSPLGWPLGNQINREVTLDNQEVVSALHMNTSSHGELVLAQLKTPGHTNDSHTYLLGIQKSGFLKKSDLFFVFSGDLILSGGLGRTNFPTSDAATLYESLNNLNRVIGSDAVICPGHDYIHSFCTNFATEVAGNSLLKLALDPDQSTNKDVFISKKTKIDHELAELEKNFHGVICGVTNTAKSSQDRALMIHPLEIKNFLDDNAANIPFVIDVSETQEFSIPKNWKSMGFPAMPRNIPLSRFINFVRELIATKRFDQKILCVCRSGERSLQAVKSLRRLNFNDTWNLEGGVVLASMCQRP